MFKHCKCRLVSTIDFSGVQCRSTPVSVMRLPACRVSAAASLRSSPIVTCLRALHASRGAAAAAGTTPVDQLRTEYDAIIVGGGELAASLDRGNTWDWVGSKILEVEGQSARGMKKREI